MFISVGVPTCNRPEDLERCLASLAEVVYADWKVIVIDQSDGDQTRLILDAWKHRIPQVIYLWLEHKNASAARNLAVENATGDVLAFIDDDCTVSPDWLDRVREAFEHEPEASLIFGAVSAAEHDPAAALVPVYEPRRTRRLQGAKDELRVRGIGASMALRLGPGAQPRFDLRLGPGGRFRSSQDVDYAYRALEAGQTVVETPRIAVTHHGARSYAEGAASIKWRDYLYGAGACHAKLLRCGQGIMVATIAAKLAESILAIRPLNALRHQPTRLGGLLMYVRGLRDGLHAPIDREHRLFL